MLNDIPRKAVLLVEDIDEYRCSLRNALMASGFTVFEAATAKEALDYLQCLPDEFDILLLVNLELPDTNGLEFVSVVREVRAGMPVLYISAPDKPEMQLLRKQADVLAVVQAVKSRFARAASA